MPGAGKFWDPSSKSYVHAQCLVTSQYVDLEKDYPAGFRQYFKHGNREARENGFRSKVDLAVKLADECKRMGCCRRKLRLRCVVPPKEADQPHRSLREGMDLRLKANRIAYHEERRMNIN